MKNTQITMVTNKPFKQIENFEEWEKDFIENTIALYMNAYLREPKTYENDEKMLSFMNHELKRRDDAKEFYGENIKPFNGNFICKVELPS